MASFRFSNTVAHDSRKGQLAFIHSGGGRNACKIPKVFVAPAPCTVPTGAALPAINPGANAIFANVLREGEDIS